MTVQTIKLGKERFVLLREKDYLQLKAGSKPGGRVRQMREQRGDVAEAKRRLADPNDKAIPWAKAKKDLGIQ